MFNFAGITHIIENPTGHSEGYNYSLVGAVPTTMLEPRVPTTADIMGGRVQADGKAYVGRKWETVSQIIDAAQTTEDVQLCASPTCACRKLF